MIGSGRSGWLKNVPITTKISRMGFGIRALCVLYAFSSVFRFIIP